MPVIQNIHPVSPEKVRMLEQKSILLRKTILKMIFTAGAGHIGGSLSCVDILNVLYNYTMNITPQNFAQIDRDHFIHSKGHSVEALYAVLGDKGFFPMELLDSRALRNSEATARPRSLPGSTMVLNWFRTGSLALRPDNRW